MAVAERESDVIEVVNDLCLCLRIRAFYFSALFKEGIVFIVDLIPFASRGIKIPEYIVFVHLIPPGSEELSIGCDLLCRRNLRYVLSAGSEGEEQE